MPTHNGQALTKSTFPPNQTLYVTNLPPKLRKPDLRLSLYTLFSTYGPVLDVNALSTKAMRGQAHVAMRDIASATQAMRALQGFDFFGKEIMVQYAKGKSDVIAKLDGTYRMPTVGGAAGGLGTDLQQSVFGTVPGQAGAEVKEADGEMDVDGVKKGLKREREESEGEGEDEGAPMEEDSDAPMEEGSDDD